MKHFYTEAAKVCHDTLITHYLFFLICFKGSPDPLSFLKLDESIKSLQDFAMNTHNLFFTEKTKKLIKI